MPRLWYNRRIMMNKTTVVRALGILALLCTFAGRASESAPLARAVQGPNEIRLEAKGESLFVRILRRGQEVVAPTAVGLTVDGADLYAASRTRIPQVTEGETEGTLATPLYKKSAIDLTGAWTFVDFGDWGVRLAARKDGVAYRFETAFTNASVTVNGERAGVRIPDGTAASWYSATTEWGCEETVPRKSTAAAPALAANELIYMPFLYETKGSAVALTDVDVRDYPVLYLRPTHALGASIAYEGVFQPYPSKTAYAEAQWDEKTRIWVDAPRSHARFIRVLEDEPYLVKTAGARTYPWRAYHLADTPAQLVASDLVYALAAPAAKGADFSWVKPGKAAWEWWNDFDNQGKAKGLNTATYERFIDFAASNRLEYLVIDAGWSDKMCIWKMNPDVDLPHLIAYAKARGVSVILWMAWAQVYGDEARVARHFAQLGAAGFKVDFMDRGDADAMGFLERFAAACAKEKLVLDYHGVVHPTGLSRTYPNILNYEAVHGLEQMKWFRGDCDMTTADVRIAHLRLLTGPMDYTPGAMLHYEVASTYRGGSVYPASFGTRARQLAMMTLFEAPLQMLCDGPTNYLKPENRESLAYMASVPTVWADTVALGGSPDTVAACARLAKDGAWYAAGIGVSSAQTFTLDTAFLKEGRWTAEIFRDGDDSGWRTAYCVHETKTVAAGEKLDFKLAPGGGFAVRFRKAN